MHAMVDNDAAFLWETGAIRTPPRPDETARRLDPPEPSASPPGKQWVTFRDAHYATGIPVETLRKWARRRSVPSSIEQTEYGTRRMVSLGDVVERAHKLGRPLTPVPDEQHDQHEPAAAAEPNPEQAKTAPEPEPTSEPAAESGTEPEPGPAAEPETAAEPDVEPALPTVAPEGTVLVPIAAWDKMLIQLGNLHEAGQELAEAKERAAKAETEAKFLHERLREIRDTQPSTHRPIRHLPPRPRLRPRSRTPREDVALRLPRLEQAPQSLRAFDSGHRSAFVPHFEIGPPGRHLA